METIKNNSETDLKFKRNVLIVFEAAVLITMIVVLCGLVKGDIIYIGKEEPTLYVTTQSYTENSTENEDIFIFEPTEKYDGEKKLEVESVPQVNDENIYVNSMPGTSNSNLSDPSGWSTAQIVSIAKDAVNKTKAYTGNLTVNHSESFSANVTECSAGGIVRAVVELMIGWVVKPVQETLVYQNGRAVNSDGETVPIVLPKKNNFSLTEKGVKSASVQLSGNEYIIRINLVEESVGMYEVPQHNADSIGYLDVASFDISFMEIDSANIVYKGSSVELRINAEGYVTYANYQIPLHIKGSAHKGSISGSATFEGEQAEVWILNY